MTATSSSAPASEAARALELITQAAAILEPVRDDGDSDRRLRLLYAICATWDESCDSEDWESIIPQTHKRWNAVSDLLEYDKSRGLLGRIYARIVQITDQAGDLICSSHDDWPRKHDHVVAVELQEAMDDLASVVRALTAVHLLEGAAS